MIPGCRGGPRCQAQPSDACQVMGPLRVVEHDGPGATGDTDNAAGAGHIPTGLPDHVCHIHTPAPEIRHNETWGTESGVRGATHPQACRMVRVPRLALAMTMEVGRQLVGCGTTWPTSTP